MAYRKRKDRNGTTIVSFGNRTPGAFESHLIWRRLEDRRKDHFWATFVLVKNETSARPRSIDVTATVPQREAQYSLTNKSLLSPPT